MRTVTGRQLGERFIESMSWSSEATEAQKNLVIGNIRGFAILVDGEMKRRDIELRRALINENIFAVIWGRYAEQGLTCTLEEMKAAAERRLIEKGEIPPRT